MGRLAPYSMDAKGYGVLHITALENEQWKERPEHGH